MLDAKGVATTTLSMTKGSSFTPRPDLHMFAFDLLEKSSGGFFSSPTVVTLRVETDSLLWSVHSTLRSFGCSEMVV